MIDYEAGILYRGNCGRIKEMLKAAEQGGVFTIGFIGGSITQGSLSTAPELCYAARVYQWFVDTFPRSRFKFINAGIGATDSQFAVARVESDLLAYEPDFCISEFAVNDVDTERYLETYEGLARRILSNEQRPAYLIFNNVFYDTGYNAQNRHMKVAMHYGVPCLGIKPTLYEGIRRGDIQAEELTPDNLHPNDLGHQLVAEHITYFLEKLMKEPENEAYSTDLPAPLTANTYERAFRLNNENSKPLLEGFVPDVSAQVRVSDCFKKGWFGAEKGAHMELEITGSGIIVQYRRTITKPAPKAKVTVDGDEAGSLILDGNFDESWGDKLCLATVLEHGEVRKRVVRVEIIDSPENLASDFYLASIIGAQ